MAETKCKRGLQSHVMCDCEPVHPLTPREKVAQIIKEKVSGPHFTDPSHFVAMEQDRFIAADAILTAIASGSGDHAELARLAEAARRVRRDSQGNLDGTDAYRRWEAFTVAANPATVLALLAEIAALRAEHVHLVEQKEGAEDALFNALSRATEAERKLAEAVGRSDDLLKALEWYGEQARLARLIHSEGDAGRHALADDGGSRARAFIANHETIRIDAFLSKEAERG